MHKVIVINKNSVKIRLLNRIGADDFYHQIYSGEDYASYQNTPKSLYTIHIVPISQITDIEAQHYINQVKIIRQLSHPHILNFRLAFNTKSNLYIAYESYEYTLFEYISHYKKGHLSEIEAKNLIKGLVDSLKYLYHNKITLGDISRQDVVLVRLPDGHLHLKLSKFLYINRTNDQNMSINILGTYGWNTSPEKLMLNSYSYSNDVWCLGLLLYYILCGKSIFKATRLSELMKQYSLGKYVYEANAYPISSEGLQMLQRMLQYNPQNRMHIEELASSSYFLENVCNIRQIKLKTELSLSQVKIFNK